MAPLSTGLVGIASLLELIDVGLEVSVGTDTILRVSYIIIILQVRLTIGNALTCIILSAHLIYLL